MKNVLGIYGAGGLGREVLELARTVNSESQRWEKIIFIVDGEIQDRYVSEVAIYSYQKAKTQFSPCLEVVIGIGEPAVRKEKHDLLATEGISLATLIHPSACVLGTTRISKGVVIGANCFISCNVCIHENCYVQPGAVIAHDVNIEQNSVVSSNVAICGHVSIGEDSYIGVGSSIKEGTSIGKNVIVGMGTVVFYDLPDEVIVLGNPGRVVRKNERKRVFG